MANQFIRAEEVANELEVSKSYAYKLIQQLNAELREKGFLCLYGCRCCEVSAHLLCSRETIPESNGDCFGIRISKLKRRSLGAEGGEAFLD